MAYGVACVLSGGISWSDHQKTLVNFQLLQSLLAHQGMLQAVALSFKDNSKGDITKT
jgi:hypothetical protein